MCDADPKSDCYEDYLQSQLGTCTIPWKLPKQNEPREIYKSIDSIVKMHLFFNSLPSLQLGPKLEQCQLCRLKNGWSGRP